MFTLKKYVEGIAVHDDDTGKSRLLNREEERQVLEEIPQLQDKAVMAYHVDQLPPCIYGGVNLHSKLSRDNKRDEK